MPTDKFSNQEPRKSKFSDFLRWRLARKRVIWPQWQEYNTKPQIQTSVENGLKITYINHVTFLIQIAGINILTDPIWSRRASPLQFIGPARVHAPGIAFAELPKIDLVLISHDHYDHLDLITIKKLQQAFQPLFLAGLQVGKYLTKVDKKINFLELDWWQTTSFKNLELTFTPSHHWSSRSLLVKNSTLWGSFIIKHKCTTIYFAGDTAMGKHFKQIAEKFGPVTMAMLPIGSHEPRWFMQNVHMNPTEALQAHNILQSKLSIAMHFNCFKDLADDQFDQAGNDLTTAIALNPQLVASGEFKIPLPGQEYEISFV